MSENVRIFQKKNDHLSQPYEKKHQPTPKELTPQKSTQNIYQNKQHKTNQEKQNAQQKNKVSENFQGFFWIQALSCFNFSFFCFLVWVSFDAFGFPSFHGCCGTLVLINLFVLLLFVVLTLWL